MTKKILLVDDEPDVTYTIKNILKDNGFAVDTFNDLILALNY
jgi:DNA-binding response OmpR family regulator